MIHSFMVLYKCLPRGVPISLKKDHFHPRGKPSCNRVQITHGDLNTLSSSTKHPRKAYSNIIHRRSGYLKLVPKISLRGGGGYFYRDRPIWEMNSLTLHLLLIQMDHHYRSRHVQLTPSIKSAVTLYQNLQSTI